MQKLSVILSLSVVLITCGEAPKRVAISAKDNASSGNIEAGNGDVEKVPDTSKPDPKEDGTEGVPESTPPEEKMPDLGTGDNTKDPVVPDPVIPKPGDMDVKGHLDVSFTVVGPSNAGPFRSRGHIRAVWISDSKNAYVRTLDYHASKRAQYLKRYNSFSGSAIDGSSGATNKSLSTPQSANVSWDLKGKDGKIVPAGTYKLWFEMAEANIAGNVAQPVDGKQSFDTAAGYAYHVVTVNVNEQASETIDSKSPVFTAIKLTRRLD